MANGNIGRKLSKAVMATLRDCLDISGIPVGTEIPDSGMPWSAPDSAGVFAQEDREDEIAAMLLAIRSTDYTTQG